MTRFPSEILSGFVKLLVENSELCLTAVVVVALRCSKLTFGSDEYLKCLARTTSATLWHWGGTCRMGRAAKASGPAHPR